jgi:hypothetical protein
MLEIRVADGSLLRLIGKCLHVGVLDGAELSTPETGAAQGSVLSPLLGNVTLHYALDLWFETEVKPRLRGRATLIRYADAAQPERQGAEARAARKVPGGALASRELETRCGSARSASGDRVGLRPVNPDFGIPMSAAA